MIIFLTMEPVMYFEYLPQMNINSPDETMKAFMKAYRCSAIAHFQMCAVVAFAKNSKRDEYYVWKLKSLKNDLNDALSALTRIRAKLDLVDKQAKL